VEGEDSPKAGDKVLCDIFTSKERVHVIGTSKGRGFGGLIKRHHFRGGRASHGSMFHRAAGSIGASAFLPRHQGNAHGGTSGNDRVTVRNMRVERVTRKTTFFICVERCRPAGGYIVVEKSGR
jgi:large subunit ribosomal protein L3